MKKQNIDYIFANESLFFTAMTHSSYANEHRDTHMQHNERLEFLGDSILGLVSADYVYHRFASLPEGELTKLRAAVVCEKTLYEVAVELGLDEELLLRAAGAIRQGDIRRGTSLLEAMQNRDTPRWMLLRGETYLAEEAYQDAAQCFLRAEAAFPEEVIPKLEHCYRELGDYKLAYQYACRQKAAGASK